MNRHTKIHTRLHKTHYRGLSNEQKKLIKLTECQTQLGIDIRNTYRSGESKYGVDFRKDERFFDDFDLIFKWEEEVMKIHEKINNLEIKMGMSEKEVRHLNNQYNSSSISF